LHTKSDILNRALFISNDYFYFVTLEIFMFNMLKILANNSIFYYSSAHDYSKEKKGCKAEDTQPAVIIKQVNKAGRSLTIKLKQYLSVI